VTAGDAADAGRGSEQQEVAAAAMAAFADRADYPMHVVTAFDGVEPSGCLVGFLTQCSILPARLLGCISKVNYTASVATGARGLGVHLLGRDQLALAAAFGEHTGDREDKMAQVRWHAGATGAPILDECAAWVEGTVRQRFDLGDHVGYLLDPVAGGGGGASGELRYAQVRNLRPGHPPGES
jgi:flavin reductase (DIM6/NTAB) family NADH-FMN oxidoreductase RutF